MEFNEEFIKLIKEVRNHRQQMGRYSSSDHNVNISDILSKIVETRVYENDYEDVTNYFQKTKVEYDEAIKAINKVIEVSIF